MESLENDLMNALETMNSVKVIDLSSKNKSKKFKFSFADYLKKLGETDLENLWKLLADMVIKLTEHAFESHADKDAECNKSFQELCAETEQLILAAIDIASAGVEMKVPISHAIFHLAIFLNGILFAIPSCIEGLKQIIIQFCEKVHHHCVLKDRSHFFLYNIIIYLIQRSLAPKATKSDVKRIYVLRKAFPGLLSVDDVKKMEILELFKKCASNKLYSRTSEGFKIITLAMTMAVEYIPEIHKLIKPQLERCALKTAISFGKTYFDAWSYAVKNVKEDFKNVLEYSCIENILILGIKGQNKSVVLNVRKFLSQFHCNKKETYVTNMLYNLYQPVLWRFLRNHDGRVRSNAAELFLDAFPFANPDSRIVASDLHLNEQLLMIKDLLLDDYPIVRCSAVIGLCISMSVNWELFPEEV